MAEEQDNQVLDNSKNEKSKDEYFPVSKTGLRIHFMNFKSALRIFFTDILNNDYRNQKIIKLKFSVHLFLKSSFTLYRKYQQKIIVSLLSFIAILLFSDQLVCLVVENIPSMFQLTESLIVKLVEWSIVLFFSVFMIGKVMMKYRFNFLFYYILGLGWATWYTLQYTVEIVPQAIDLLGGCTLFDLVLFVWTFGASFPSFFFIIDKLNCKEEPLKDGFVEDKALLHDDDKNHSKRIVADDLSKRLRNQKFEKSFNVGVIGPWGSGKSSFTQLLKQNLNDGKSMIVDYSPMFNHTESNIIRDFFEAIRDEVSLFDASLGKSILKYSEKVAKVWKDKTFSNLFSQDLLFTSNEPVKKLYDHINDVLRGLNRKLFVFIDDLDRLNANEILEILKLIRNTADFHNTVFVVNYDKDYVTRIITNQRDTNGVRFLEKFFHLDFFIPQPRAVELRKFFEDEISDQVKNPAEILSIFKTSMFDQYITSYRDVTKLVNIFKIEYGELEKLNLQQSICLSDFLDILFLKQNFPSIYYRLQRDRDLFLNEKGMLLEVISKTSKKDNEANDNEYVLINYVYKHKEGLNLDKNSHVTLLESTIKNLFIENKDRKRSKYSITNPINYFAYFRFGMGEDVISIVEFEREINEIDIKFDSGSVIFNWLENEVTSSELYRLCYIKDMFINNIKERNKAIVFFLIESIKFSKTRELNIDFIDVLKYQGDLVEMFSLPIFNRGTVDSFVFQINFLLLLKGFNQKYPSRKFSSYRDLKFFTRAFCGGQKLESVQNATLTLFDDLLFVNTNNDRDQVFPNDPTILRVLDYFLIQHKIDNLFSVNALKVLDYEFLKTPMYNDLRLVLCGLILLKHEIDYSLLNHEAELELYFVKIINNAFVRYQEFSEVYQVSKINVDLQILGLCSELYLDLLDKEVLKNNNLRGYLEIGFHWLVLNTDNAIGGNIVVRNLNINKEEIDFINMSRTDKIDRKNWGQLILKFTDLASISRLDFGFNNIKGSNTRVCFYNEYLLIQDERFLFEEESRLREVLRRVYKGFNHEKLVFPIKEGKSLVMLECNELAKVSSFIISDGDGVIDNNELLLVVK